MSRNFRYFINFKFDKDGLSYQYGFSTDKSYHSVEGKSLHGTVMDYKIQHNHGTIITLSRYWPDDKKQKCFITLLKVVDGKLIN